MSWTTYPSSGLEVETPSGMQGAATGTVTVRISDPNAQLASVGFEVRLRREDGTTSESGPYPPDRQEYPPVSSPDPGFFEKTVLLDRRDRTAVQPVITLLDGTEIRPAEVAFGPQSAFGADLALLNFREVRRTETEVVYGWTRGQGTVEVSVHDLLHRPPTSADPWPGQDAVPTLILKVENEYAAKLPAVGEVRVLQFEPRDAGQNPGQVQRVKLEGLPEAKPSIDYIGQAPASGANRTDVVAVVTDPLGRPGRLHTWLNHASTENPNPDSAADGYLDLAAPRSVTSADVWQLAGGGTARLFDELTLDAGRGKRIYLEFVASDGVSTGKVDRLLQSWSSIVDAATGGLLAGVVNEAALALRSVGKHQLKLGGVERENLIDAAIDAAKLDDGILDLTQFSRVVASNAIIGDKLAVDELSEIIPNAGIIISGELRNAAGTRYIDLDATGAQPFIAHEKFELRADGSAFFRGTITSEAAITGRLVVAGNLGEGAIDLQTIIQDGMVTARKLQIAELSEIKDENENPVSLGVIVRGVLHNAGAGGVTAGIRLSSADAWPGSSGSAPARFLDFGTTQGTDLVLKLPGLEITHGGSATFSGALDAAEGTFSGKVTAGGSIRSTTYVAGSSGWSINATGSAEFNDVTIRGTLDGVTGTFAGALGANSIELRTSTGGLAGSLGMASGSFDFNDSQGGTQLRVADGFAVAPVEMRIGTGAKIGFLGTPRFDGPSLPSSAGTASGRYWEVKLNGTIYRIALLNP